MERNNLLNLLIAGGIAVAIALGGASLGVAVKNKSKSTGSTSTGATGSKVNVPPLESTSVLKRSGAISLYGGFKPLTNDWIRKASQEILEITVGKNNSMSKLTLVPVVAEAVEVVILDLSKTVGKIEWIRQQLIRPKSNVYTDQISVKTLHEAGYKQKIVFAIIQNDKTTFNDKKFGIFTVEIKTEYVAAVPAVGNNLATVESWNLVFDLIAKSSDSKTFGVKATSTVAKKNSILLKDELANSDAILAKGIDVLLWRTGGEAAENSSDFDVAIILKKKTGEVYVYSDIGILIVNRQVEITQPTLGS